MNFTHANASLPSVNDPCEWVMKYLGKPWVSGACGPDAFDCWGLLFVVYRDHFATEIPRFPGVREVGAREVVRLLSGWDDAPEWEPLETPCHGCAVAMSKHTRFHHVGMYLDVDDGLILHAADGKNVVAESLHAVRHSGMNRFAYYRPRVWSQS